MDGKPIYYWTNRQDQQVPDDAGFVGVVNSTNITVRDLVLTKNSKGLLFAFTNNSNIENVSVSNNYYGIHLFGSRNNTITSNAASSNRDSSIYLEYSSNNTLINNNASNNDREGIYLGYYSNNNMLMNNIASNNDDEGIYLFGRSNNNTLQDNTVSNNDEGIYLTWDANNNTLTNNTANSNHYGIRIGSSTNNAIHHNNLLDNTLCNACDECTNQWDSGSEGNYYSDYTGTDNNTDGIGDDPHPIPGGSSVDRYPLMHPWTGDTPQKGDLNSDGILTPADAAIALRIAAIGAHDDAADVSGDGRVTSLDALMILQAAAGNIEDPITGCGDLDQSILRMYDDDGDGWIDDQWTINAGIDLDYGRITQSEYDQVKYAYEHNCPVEPAE